MNDTAAFIGGGNMTRAIVLGMLAKGTPAERLRVGEFAKDRREALARELPGVSIYAGNREAIAGADTVVLAVKPDVMRQVCEELRPALDRRRHLLISIAAGTRSTSIDGWLGGGFAIVRVMPNQPALLGLGVAGLFANERAGAGGLARAEAIMGATGRTVAVPEEADIDAVTAVSGSGPAYFFLLIDILAKSGETLGLDRDTAATLALETARGSAALAIAGEEDMTDLIARVRSPGGTTAAALDSLDNDDVRAIFARALRAARDRAGELADNT